jgi:hypothetical protein
MHRAVALFALMIGFIGTARAQTVQEIDKRDAAVYEAWNATPLTVRHVVFVSQEPNGFGRYVARENNVFAPGEKLVTYAEPVGYAWKDDGKGQYQFGFSSDFVIKTPDGKVLAQQQDFAKTLETSHARNREFNMVLTMAVNGASPGDYVLEYKLHDLSSDKTATFDQPFKIAK